MIDRQAAVFRPLPVAGTHASRNGDSADTSADPRKLQLHRPVPQRDVPYLPTDPHIVSALLDLAEVKPNDVLYDLGCGDGRIVIEAAKRGARAFGVDIDLTRIRECHENLHKTDVGGRATFRCASFFDVNLADATVVTLYLLPGVNVKLRPKLLFELKPGTRIVANYFDIGDWQPDQHIRVKSRDLMKWVIPAWVAGQWHCTLIDAADGTRRRMRLDLHRRYQQVWGTARIGGRREIPLTDVQLIGDNLSFTVSHWRQMRPAMKFVATLRDEQLRGSFSRVNYPGVAGAGGVWCGLRAER